MRTLFLASLLGLTLVGSASAADLRYGWDQPPTPAQAYREDDEDDSYRRPRWRDPEWRRPPPPRVRIEERDDDEDEPECWTRRTPYGPERVCR